MPIDTEIEYTFKKEQEAAEEFNHEQSARTKDEVIQPSVAITAAIDSIGQTQAISDEEKAVYEKQLLSFPGQKRSIEAVGKLIDYYEGLKKREEESYHLVGELVEKSSQGELSSDELGCLAQWLTTHEEFGLKEMSDEEYLSFFTDGQIYAHSTSFFGESREGMPTPRFIEGLKDGFLISSIINQERGQTTVTQMVGQRYVTFDNPNLIAEHLNDRRLEGDKSSTDQNLHFGYVAYNSNPDINAPVVLLAPAKLLEKHNTNILEEHRLNQELGIDSRIETRENPFTGYAFMDGTPFGSTSKDPNSLDHEIDLSMFTAIMPDVETKPEFVSSVLENLSSDPRVTEEMKCELSSYGGASPRLKEFMFFVTGILKKGGFSVPHLFFFKPVDKFTDTYGYATAEQSDWVMRNGVQDFLKTGDITPEGSQPKTFLHEGPEDINSDKVSIESDRIPEIFRFPVAKIEELTNNVRRVIKRQKPELLN